MSQVEEQRFSVVDDGPEGPFEKPVDSESFFNPAPSEDLVEEHIQNDQNDQNEAQNDQNVNTQNVNTTQNGNQNVNPQPNNNNSQNVNSQNPAALHPGSPDLHAGSKPPVPDADSEIIPRTRTSSAFRGVLIPGTQSSEPVSRESSYSSSSSSREISSVESLRHPIEKKRAEMGHKRGGSEVPVSQEFMEEFMKETERAERARETQAHDDEMTAEEKQEEILADLMDKEEGGEEKKTEKEEEEEAGEGSEAPEESPPQQEEEKKEKKEEKETENESPEEPVGEPVKSPEKKAADGSPALQARVPIQAELKEDEASIQRRRSQSKNKRDEVASPVKAGGDLRATMEALAGEPAVPKEVEGLLNRDLVHGEPVVSKPLSKEEEQKLLWSLWRNKIEVAHSESAPKTLRSSDLIAPSVFVDLPAADPLADLISKQFGTQHGVKRLLLDVMDVDHNINGLKELMEADSWRAAAVHAAKLLADFVDSLGIEEVMQIFLCRIIALVKLRSFETALQELRSLGNLDFPEFFYEHYPETFPNRRGSMIPFSIRVLAASLPHQLGRTSEALDQLAQLQVHLRGILAALDKDMLDLPPHLKEAAKEVWQKREAKLSLMIVNHLYNLKDFQLATQVMQEIVGKHPENVVYQSALGRLHLQLGNITEAKHVFLHLRAAHMADPKYQTLIGVNDGYLHMATGSMKHALESFEKVQRDSSGQVNLVASSNAAICHLYLGNLRQAIATLEGLLTIDPEKHLSETLIFNLCTLYELQSDHHVEKKKYLMKLAAAHLGDHFNSECLKFGTV